MVRLTDRPDMTLDVYRGRKITTQDQIKIFIIICVNHLGAALLKIGKLIWK